MTWFAAGAAAVSVATTYIGGQAQASSAIKSLNTATAAEGKAVVKERLNASIRNSYNTALAQQQLALQKRQLSGQAASISAASLAAQGDASVAAASTGSTGSSIDAISADIDMKAQSALDQTTDAFENAISNYNSSLDLMVINTDQSAPNVRQAEYTGPSSAAVLGGALMAGASSFASNYAMRAMSLSSSKPTTQSAIPASSMYSLGSNSYFR